MGTSICSTGVTRAKLHNTATVIHIMLIIRITNTHTSNNSDSNNNDGNKSSGMVLAGVSQTGPICLAEKDPGICHFRLIPGVILAPKAAEMDF